MSKSITQDMAYRQSLMKYAENAGTRNETYRSEPKTEYLIELMILN